MYLSYSLYVRGHVCHLQAYDFTKKVERCWKVYIKRKDADGVSVLPPDAYQRRFMDNLALITANDTELAAQEEQFGAFSAGLGSVFNN